MNYTEAAKAHKSQSKVKYTGTNRPVLKNYYGKIADHNHSSARVEFFTSTGRFTQSEWVGFGALALVGEINPAIESAVSELESKRKDLQAQIDAVDTAINALKSI